MKKNYLDHIVKKALEQFEVPFSAKAWKEMEQQIDLDPTLNPTSETAFDETIKNALLADSFAVPAMDWDKMESLIEQDALLSDIEFDEQFKDVLEQVRVPYTSDDWDMMEAQLDFEENMIELNDSDAIDSVVYNKLNNLQADIKSSNWRALSHKLELQPAYRKKVVLRNKITEVALLFLLLLTIFNFLPTSSNTNKTVVHQDIASSAIESPMISEFNIAAEAFETVPSKTKNPVLSTVIKEKISSTNLLEQEVTAQTNNTISSMVTFAEKQEELILTKVSITSAETKVSGSTIVLEEDKTAPSNIVSMISAKFSDLGKGISNRNLIGMIDTDFWDSYTNQTGLRFLPTAQISLISIDENTQLPGCLTCDLPRKMLIRAGMFLVGDYNYVMTPNDRLFDIASYNNASLGYGLGSSLAFSYNNKWEVETGLIYSSKVYQLEPLTETIGDFEAGYVSRSLTSIQLNVLQIPLNIRYNFDNLPNWNIYASTGASLQIAAQTIHNLDSEFTSDPSRNESTSRNSIGELIEENSSFNQKNFSDGWLEGGSFLENRYFTANISMGVERSIGSRYSLFTQSVYQHTLLSNGFGPNKDRMNTLSVITGVRAIIGKRMKVQKF